MKVRLLPLFFLFITPLIAMEGYRDSYWMHNDSYQPHPRCAEDFHECENTSYPYFNDNPLLTKAMKKRFLPYLLPLNHPLKPSLDALFSSGRVTESKTTLEEAGFQILFSQPRSFVTVARHPQFPGFIFKLYLDTETQLKYNFPSWYWLANRCEGAMRIRECIKKHHIRFFRVPDKWLYLLPVDPPSNGPIQQPVIVIETDMNLVSDSIEVWKNVNDKEVLDELYQILSKGYGSHELGGNVPYSQNGQFVFIDTEYPLREIGLKRVKPYLSPKMADYWEHLIKK